MLNDSVLKAGVNKKLNEILRGFKEGIKERKVILKRRQTVHSHARAPKAGRGLSVCPSTNFHFKLYNFQTTLNLQNFLFLQILPIL